MKVKLAETAGFCWGVKRAMDIVLKVSEKTKGILYTYGPLIHNPQVIEILEKKGIKVINDVSGLKPGTSIIIRTHGITPQERERIKSKEIVIKDATCPLVMKVQSIIKRNAQKGYFTIIIGDQGHAEVTALMGFASSGGVVINSVDDLLPLPELDKVCVVAQTTLETTKFDEITAEIKKKYPSAEISNTICDATEQRQSEALEICSTVDAMIVVGGRNSANTNRLANVCKSTDTPTFLVETEKELDEAELLKFKNIGVTAGASTPNWLIGKVVEKVEKVKTREKNFLLQGFIDFCEFVIKSNIYTAFGGYCLTYCACKLQDIPPRLPYMFISLLYLFAMYVLNNFTDQEAIKITFPVKKEFLKRNQLNFILCGTAALLFSLFIAAGLGVVPFILLLLSSALGVAYSIKLTNKIDINLFKFQRLKDIPGSKDLFVSFAWSVITVLIPFASVYDGTISTKNVTTFMFVFTIVYIRSLLFDIKDLQGDKIVGRETIPIIIGKERTKSFLTLLAILSVLILSVPTLLGFVNSLGYYLLFSVLYICFYLYVYNKKIISRVITFEGIVDGGFIFAGLITLLAV